MYGYDINMKWKGHCLYLKNKKYAELLEHSDYKNMYFIRWMSGIISSDFYNISRAKYHAGCFAIHDTIRETV
jgi:hypothetical protein